MPQFTRQKVRVNNCNSSIFSLIILMQRRKLLSQLKTKPKLVLDRLPYLNSDLDKRNESSPITFLNLKNINTIQKHLDQQIESHSNGKTSKKSLIKNQHPIKNHLTLQKQNRSRNYSKNPQQKDLRRLRKKSNSQHLIQNNLIALERCFKSEDKTEEVKNSEVEIGGFLKKIISQCNYNREIISIIIQKLKFFLETGSTYVSPSLWVNESKKQETRNIVLSIYSCEKFQYLPQQAKLQQKSSIESNNASNNISNIEEQIMSEEQISDKSRKDINSARFQFEHLSELDDYIMNQPNKILHEALRRHRYLEQQLFGYSDYLQISHLGACTYVTQNNIPAIEFQLDRQMKDLNRQIIQGPSPLDVKCKMLRDFVLFVRSSYNNTLIQLMKVNDAKTAMIKTFVHKVLKWRENYLVRKEYLNNLKKDYCSALYRIGKGIHGIRHAKENQEFRQERLIIGLQEDIAEIHKIFLAGNSFY